MDGWMNGWMDGSSVPSKTAGADSILYTTRQQTHQLHGPEKRLPSYTSRGFGVDCPGPRGERLGPGSVRVSAAAGRCGRRAGHEYGPRPGGMRVYEAVRLDRICSLLDPAAPLRRAWPMRCYTIRGPPIRTHTVGYGRAGPRFEQGPRKGNFACVVIWWVLPVGMVRD